jgi:hypothetical protein
MKTEEIRKLFNELKRSFEVGTIDEEEFQAETKDLFFQDSEGNYWTIGAKTEKWYRHEDGDWVQDSPPPTLEPVRREIRPPGMEQRPLPPSKKRGYDNRIVLALVSFSFLLCLIAVALVSYQVGRMSVSLSSEEPTPTAAVAMTQMPTTEATLPSQVSTIAPSPGGPGSIATPPLTATEEQASPTSMLTPSTPPTPRATAVPQPTATPMPTPEMKYGPPILALPENGAQFGPGYDAVLEWQPVGELAEDEYYDVQVCWNNRSECWGQYQQGTSWTFPSFRRGAAIDERYYWDITVRVQTGDTRNGPSDPPISPQSETWVFLLTTN